MPALRELQRDFADALFSAQPAAADGIEIYRNNLREGFIKALAIGFPVIERLVGAEYFRRLALDFLGAHPSRNGNLHHIGAPFPRFLGSRFESTEYAYLADVAALEWAHQEVLIAADARPITVETLHAIPDTDYETLRFDLQPAAALVRSVYPILRIWSANQPHSSADEQIDLAEGGDNVLVLRTAECIEFHRLPAGDFVALEILSRGDTIGTAFEAAASADSAFDLATALQRFFSLGLFVGLHTHVFHSEDMS
jgi:hypothetical protein